MNVDELISCIVILLNYVKRTHGISKIKLDNDYYWDVNPEERFLMESEPGLIVGSLFDDKNCLLAMLKDPNRASAVDIDRAASLLKIVSDQISHTPLSRN